MAKKKASESSNSREWYLEDGTSFPNLKVHSAFEGYSEVQYDLVQKLLNKTNEPSRYASTEPAIHWLCCATENGHHKAAKLLQECLDNRCGINSNNECNVRRILSMSSGERAARKAARELFTCLSNGNEHITPKQLERKMREIYNIQKKGKISENSTSNSQENNDNERKLFMSCLNKNENDKGYISNEHLITEENLISAAINYTAGQLPEVNSTLACRISEPHPSTLDHIPYFHRLFFSPITYFTLLYHRFVNLICSLDYSPNFYYAFLIIVYWIASGNNFNLIIPIGFYYICWGIMIWSSCKMLKTKQDYIDFQVWSGLFITYGDQNVQPDISENRFLKNNVKPYCYFFIAFIGNIISYPFIEDDWLLHSELTVISCAFVFISLFVFMYTTTQSFPDWIVLTSFGINVLAKYPYEMDEVVTTGWRFLDLKFPTFCSFVIGNGIEFCLNCRAVLYLLIPGFLIHLGKRSNWNGIYTHLIPHCITLCWLSLCISSSQSSTMFGMIRATLGLSGILLFLPLFGIISLLIPVFMLIDWVGITNPKIRFGSSLISAVLALVGSCYLAINRRTKNYITIFQITVCLVSLCILTFPYMTSDFKNKFRYSNTLSDTNKPIAEAISKSTNQKIFIKNDNEYLSSNQYYRLCGQQNWENNNKIESQLRCLHLKGMSVSWEGTVSKIQIISVNNPIEDYITKFFPNWLINIIRCLYGHYIPDDLKCSDELCYSLHSTLKNNFVKKCSLDNWNLYDYEVYVTTPANDLLNQQLNVILHAEHIFGNITHKLVMGDRIHFYGILSNSYKLCNDRLDYTLLSNHIYVDAVAMECIQCEVQNIPFIALDRFVNATDIDRIRDLVRGIKYLLNIIFNPLITFS